MRDMFKLGITMALYAVAACVGLALVYNLTKDHILKNETKDLEAALFQVFPEADSFATLLAAPESPDPSIRFDNAWTLKKGERTIGIAIRTLAESYGGTLTSLVGIGESERVNGVRILANSDTPGLGANAASPTYYVDKASKTSFFGQFTGKSAHDPFTVKGDVLAITASTITSHAVSRSVKAAADAAVAWFNSYKIQPTEEGPSL